MFSVKFGLTFLVNWSDNSLQPNSIKAHIRKSFYSQNLLSSSRFEDSFEDLKPEMSRDTFPWQHQSRKTIKLDGMLHSHKATALKQQKIGQPPLLF